MEENSIASYIQDNELYLARLNGFRIYDISNPVEPQLEVIVENDTIISDVEVVGSRIFTAGENGLCSYNYVSGQQPEIIENLNRLGTYGSIRKYQDYLYVITTNGLQVIDYSNPQSPEIVNNFDQVKKGDSNILIHDDYLYTISPDEHNEYRSMLKIYSLNNPAEPELLESRFMAIDLPKMYHSGEYFLLLDGSRMKIFDGEDTLLQNILYSGTHEGSEYGYDSIMFGNFIILRDHFDNLIIYQFNGIDECEQVNYDESNQYSGFIESNDRLYAWYRNYGDSYICEISINSDGNIEQISENTINLSENERFHKIINIPDEYRNLLITQRSIYQSASKLLGVYDIESDLSYEHLGYIHLEDGYNDVGLISDNLIRTQNLNLSLYDFSDILPVENLSSENPESFELISAYPNPFNSTIKLNYTLSNNAEVNFSVFNLLGQKVASIDKYNSNAGTHALIWKAENLSSGTYWIQLKTDQQVIPARKVILMK